MELKAVHDAFEFFLAEFFSSVLKLLQPTNLVWNPLVEIRAVKLCIIVYAFMRLPRSAASINHS